MSNDHSSEESKAASLTRGKPVLEESSTTFVAFTGALLLKETTVCPDGREYKAISGGISIKAASDLTIFEQAGAEIGWAAIVTGFRHTLLFPGDRVMGFVHGDIVGDAPGVYRVR